MFVEMVRAERTHLSFGKIIVIYSSWIRETYNYGDAVASKAKVSNPHYKEEI